MHSFNIVVADNEGRKKDIIIGKKTRIIILNKKYEIYI